MIGPFLGVALLSAAWLFGLSYYVTASLSVCVAALALGAALLYGVEIAWPARRVTVVALALLILPVLLVPWPYRVGPLLLGMGLAAGLLSGHARGEKLARALVAAGVVLLVQGLAVQAYAAFTARSHDLPAWLVELLAGLARLLGADASASGTEVTLRTLRGTQRLAATWDLLADPASVWFFVGAATLLGLRAASPRYGLRAWLGAVGRLALVAALWLPLRAGLLLAVFLDRVERFTAAAPLHVMNHFFSPWGQVPLLGLLALVCWRLVSMSAAEPDIAAAEPSAESARDPVPRATVALALAAALFTAAIYWDPPGRAKPGRVMFVERHSTWEPSVRPYDTTWYGEPSGYNYYVAFDYCRRFYEMSHLLETETIDDRRLAACDVLVIKTPTARYAPEEIDAIERFVGAGGGLLLIGEHTNFDRTGTCLNDISRRFGFRFRYDLLFGFDVAYDQAYRVPTVPHPAVQHLPPLDFAVSCSIDPGTSLGRAAIANTGLWSLPPAYHTENFFPVPNHRAEMRYGSFVQLWAVEQGRGRVLAFTDSTIFSNFAIFEPAKLELLLGMMAWLNQTNLVGDPRHVLMVLGLVPLVAAGWMLRRRTLPLVLLLAVGTCSAVVAGQVIAATQRWALPLPQPQRPMTRVIVDRTVSEVPLTKSGFTDPSGRGYGIVEQWLGRLGYFCWRASGAQALSGNVLVVLSPTRPVSDEYRQQVADWVQRGGRLLVFDSPLNKSSTANSLLKPFQISVHHDRAWQGELIGQGEPGVAVEQAAELSGGQTVARVGPHPVAVTARHGQGSVLVVGFATLFNDENMGSYWNQEPDAPTRARFDLFFRLVRLLE
jgi:hypothetical protein